VSPRQWTHEIARALRRSRTSVTGKANRLGLDKGRQGMSEDTTTSQELYERWRLTWPLIRCFTTSSDCPRDCACLGGFDQGRRGRLPRRPILERFTISNSGGPIAN